MPDVSRIHAQNTSASLFDGRYRLGDGRWEGAVGVVREAFDTSQGDLRVVIKHPDPYQGPEVRAYKEQLLDFEAQALERLDALPHICRMLNRGQVGSGPGAYRYLVIEWADGQPVAGLLQDAATEGRSLPIGTLLVMLVQLARVLAEAHEQGLINNDVDVKHLYWNEGARTLKVIDWGNAKLTSSPDWASYSFQDDVVQFADVMYCLLTGRQALDEARPDRAFWQEALEDVLPVVRGDLARIGHQASPPHPAYPRAVELRDDLEACLARFREHLAGPLARVDGLLAEASPESLAQAEERLRALAALAPVDEGVLERTETLARIRRERRETAAMQLGSAYIKAESWHDAVEVLSRTFGHQAPAESAPGMLLAAAKLLDAHRSTLDEATEQAWATAAKALVERQLVEAVDAYLGAPPASLDTTVEPLRTLLEITERYVLRHDLGLLVRALADLREGARRDTGAGGNSHGAPARPPAGQVGRAHRDLRQALSALNACPAHDWVQQHAAYERVAAALEGALRLPGLPEGLRAHLEACAERADGLVRRAEGVEEALAAGEFARAAEALEGVVRIDPDNPSPARQAERLRRLTPVFEEIHRADGWHEGAWKDLARRVLGEVEAAFTSLPGSSLKTRALELAEEAIARQAARREEEHLAEGLRLLEEGDWYAAREWAARVLGQHAHWAPGAYVAGLAEAYVALYDPEEPDAAPGRAQEALQGLEALPVQHETLRAHKKRLEVMAECVEHLLSPDESHQTLAQMVAQNLPEGDAHRAALLTGIGLTRELRAAVRGGRWEEALRAAEGLHAARMPVIAALAGAWRGMLELLSTEEVARDAGQYPQALGALENALYAVPTVELGRPAPTVQAVREGIHGARETLAEEWAARRAEEEAAAAVAEPEPEPAPTGRSRREAAGDRGLAALRRAGAQATRLTTGLRQARLPEGRQVVRGAGDWLQRAARRLNAAIEGRPTTARRRHAAPPVAPSRRPAPRPAGDAEDNGSSPRGEDEPASRHAVARPDRPDRAERLERTVPAERRERPERPGPMRWAIGGAAVVGLVALAVALALARTGQANGGLGRSPVQAGISRIEGLLAQGDDAGAAAALGELLAEHAASVSAEEREVLAALDDCLWLRAEVAGAVALTPADLRASLERLGALWARAAGTAGTAPEDGDPVCPLEGGVSGAVASVAAARRAEIEGLLAVGTPEAYRGALGALEGLDLGPLGALLGDEEAFDRLALDAQVGLARLWLAQGDCAQAEAAIADARGMLGAAAPSEATAAVEALGAEQAACAGVHSRCEALRALAAASPAHPGDDLLVLAGAQVEREALARACPDVAFDALVAGRLEALRTLGAAGDHTGAIAEGLKIAAHPGSPIRPMPRVGRARRRSWPPPTPPSCRPGARRGCAKRGQRRFSPRRRPIMGHTAGRSPPRRSPGWWGRCVPRARAVRGAAWPRRGRARR